MSKVNFYFSYMGGKAREYKYIKPLIKFADVDKIVEPFCGSAAMSYACFKDGFTGEYFLNDNDRELIGFLNDVKQNGSAKYVEHALNIMSNEFTKEKHDNVIKQYKQAKTLEGFFYYNKVYNFRKGLYPDPAVRAVIISPGMYNEIDKFYRNDRVKYSCNDYRAIFEQFKDDEKALLFLDPPYFSSFNSKYSDFSGTSAEADGTLKDNTQMYVDIANYLKTAKCKIIMIINSNAIVNELYRDFIGEQYTKQYNLTQKVKQGKGIKNKTGHMVVTNIRE